MTVIASPYKCEECPELKRPSNGWFIGLHVGNLNLAVGGDTEMQITRAALVCEWTDALAAKIGVAHLCGIDCALRWQAKQLAKLQASK